MCTFRDASEGAAVSLKIMVEARLFHGRFATEWVETASRGFLNNIL